ncbi:MAG: rhodanese-like domain-containing protein [Polyangiaceae bacterium]
MNQTSREATGGRAGPEEIQYKPLRVAMDRTIRILDIREPYEIDILGFVPGSCFIPGSTLAEGTEDLLAWFPLDAPIAVVCQSGRRARELCPVLRSGGFHLAGVLTGGMLAWGAQSLPTCAVADLEEEDIPPLGDLARFPRVLTACFVASTAENAHEDPAWGGMDPAAIVSQLVTEETTGGDRSMGEALERALHRVAAVARERGFPLEDIRHNTDRMRAALRKLG